MWGDFSPSKMSMTSKGSQKKFEFGVPYGGGSLEGEGGGTLHSGVLNVVLVKVRIGKRLEISILSRSKICMWARLTKCFLKKHDF